MPCTYKEHLNDICLIICAKLWPSEHVVAQTGYRVSVGYSILKLTFIIADLMIKMALERALNFVLD